MKSDRKKLTRHRFLKITVVALSILLVVGGLVHYFFPRAIPMAFCSVPIALAKMAPQTAWTYGSPILQGFAAKTLASRIQPGMPYDEVYAVLGNGALHGERLKGRKPRDGEIISFNVRSWYNNGLDITFTNGVVASVFYYD